MIPVSTFQAQPRHFWAHVKLLSEGLNYSLRGTIRRYTLKEIQQFLTDYGLSSSHLQDPLGPDYTYGDLIVAYINYRADVLERSVLPNLMNREQAKADFEQLRSNFKATLPQVYNKQSGIKRHPAYLTCIVNLLTEQVLDERYFNHNPQGLIVVTNEGRPLRTFSRRMDGAYPSIVNPLAVWEIKEYYGTTTFGSRVADGVYETMLDGEEFAELQEHSSIEIKHYLIVDDYFTWWVKGKSYLCRIIHMLHMGLVDEVLFGKEVLTRWPEIVRSWLDIDFVRPDLRPLSPKVIRERRRPEGTLWENIELHESPGE
ncbi:MAG: hypothetical protein H0W02_21325 [Ktedonobacteraceae bacterium]|nr:hypothetical protein [Ktedonobacteraceae bacterium]